MLSVEQFNKYRSISNFLSEIAPSLSIEKEKFNSKLYPE